MRWVLVAAVWLWLVPCSTAALAGDRGFPALTNVSQLARLAGLNLPVSYSVRFEGDVLWVDNALGQLVLQDDSGMALLEMDLRGHLVSAGQRVQAVGNGTVVQTGAGYRIGINGAVVDNNGIHSMQERSGSIWLESGRHPIRLEWFNRTWNSGLEVEYEGPDIPRQSIPDAALLRPATKAASSSLVRGLDYECFEFDGDILPNSPRRTVLRSGVTDSFDLRVCSRPENVGLEFAGYIEVPRDGLYTFYTRSDDGSRLFVDAPSLRVHRVGPAGPKTPRPLAPGQPVEAECQWAEVSGNVAFVSEPGKQLELELRSGSGSLQVHITAPGGWSAEGLRGRRIKATGVCLGALTPDGQRIAGRLLVSGEKQIELLATEPGRLSGGTNGLPVLTTAAEVHGLKREEAQRGYPVHLRGVVTCVLPEIQGFTLQDATHGVYATDLSLRRPRLPEIGSYVEIRGTTDPRDFAPIVNATELSELGAGWLPDPVRPTWDQLINGSLDAQYVEIQGIITAVNTNGVTLLAREGRINVELRVAGLANSELPRFENSLVRLRGCLFANWNYLTHRVKAGEVRLHGASISVDQPAPADLFAVRKRTFEELLLFDPEAGAFQRVRVAGLVLYAHEAECFLTDGKSGLRVLAAKPSGLGLAPGDLAEVVGFSDLSGVSPTLREAVVRKSRRVPLPPATVLPKDDMLDARYDASLVQASGTLVSLRRTRSEQVLEMQSGVRSFVARLAGSEGLKGSLPPGSLLELTGVYAGLGGNKAIGQDITSFELLLNGPSDIQVLARPPWWTLRRLLAALGGLVCVLTAALVWIKQLRWQVNERTRQLEKQIRERERIEHQRALEQERSRVAQDLHDDLGAGLTEISVLGNQVRSRAASEQQRSQYLEQIDERAVRMVSALDEIVWAMSPAQDSLDSLVSYFCLHADRFLGAANIAWRLEGGKDLPNTPVNSLCRHELFMAFKEALTNVVRHSGATEVKVGFRLERSLLVLTVADNGRGIAFEKRSRHSDGLANMRARMEKLKGEFEIASQPGQGAVLRFSVPADK
jgi:signal transduction histidine kinase